MTKQQEEELLSQLEEQVISIQKFIKNIPEDSWVKPYAAERFVFESVLWGAGNLHEAVGMFEMGKLEYIHSFKEASQEESCNCENCSTEEEVPQSKYTC